jgi:alpha-glucuronidase
MLRLLKSSGINALAIQDVNSCGVDTATLDSRYITNVTRNLGPIFKRFAITPYWSICFAAPTVFANISADPASTQTQQWWKDKADEIYGQLPELGGFLVKADSEGNTGPMQFNRTEADGANMLARALKPHGGTLLWRAFVYGAPNEPGDIGVEDLARQSFDTFKPIDGKFDSNVILQIKNGPMDFQIR